MGSKFNLIDGSETNSQNWSVSKSKSNHLLSLKIFGKKEFKVKWKPFNSKKKNLEIKVGIKNDYTFKYIQYKCTQTKSVVWSLLLRK